MKRALMVGLVLASLVPFLIDSADARGRGGGGGGRGGGGARMSSGSRSSAARSASSRSMPSNYGSLQQSHSVSSRSIDSGNYRGDSGSFETRRGGEGTVGVSDSGDVGIRGETAGGRDYAGIQVNGGDRVVVGENRQGEIVARARGDGDGVVEVLPDGARAIYIDDDPYYYDDYHYYWPYYYGGSVYYQEVYPPYGAGEEQLPAGTETVTVNNTVYYVYDGVYYIKEGDSYVVSAPPDATAAAPAPAGPSASELMKTMCAHVATYTNFFIDSVEQIERPGKGPATVKRRILLNRPDRVTASGQDGTDKRRFWYDGKTATSLDTEKNVFSTIDAPPTIGAMVSLLQEDYGVTIPLVDLLMPDLCDSLGTALDEMKYVGKDSLSGVECHKLTLMTRDYYAQIWISTDEKMPIPRKVDIMYMTDASRPRYVGVITRWETRPSPEPDAFVFNAPEGATEIEMLKRP